MDWWVGTPAKKANKMETYPDWGCKDSFPVQEIQDCRVAVTRLENSQARGR